MDLLENSKIHACLEPASTLAHATAAVFASR